MGEIETETHIRGLCVCGGGGVRESATGPESVGEIKAVIPHVRDLWGEIEIVTPSWGL